MITNAKVQLMGYLGKDPKLSIKGNKNFAILRVATNDSYPVKNGNDTIWKKKETKWHEVFVFRPSTIERVKGLKKGCKVELSGTLSYQPFKDQNGYSHNQAFVIANIVEEANDWTIDKVVAEEIIKDVVKSMAA